MFLHAGTAFHRHEFSAPLDPRSSSSAFHRSSLQRSAFSVPNRKSSPAYYRPTPIVTRPGRPLSDVPRRTTEPVVRFQGAETDTMSEDTKSLANSDTSEVPSSEMRARRRRQRTSTTFHLAHPAPTLTQKQKLINIPPRVLLQLQRLSPDSRPEPAVDVLPSAAGITRLAQKFPRMFRGKAALGTNDVMVVQSEEYDSPDDATGDTVDSDEENLASRDLMAVICQMPKDAGGLQGKAEIVLSDGTVWVATPRPSGIYEFVTVDENGLKMTARWVRRSSAASSGDLSPESGHAGLKYTFSIIDPSSRRHPILGSLTQNTLDIPDFYTSVSSSAKKYPPPTHARPLSADPDSMDDELTPERTTHVVYEETKKLIQVTAIWVALREGLSPYFRYNDSAASAGANICRTTGMQLHGRARSVSLTPDARRPGVAPSTTSTTESCQLVAAGSKLRRACTTGPAVTATAPRLDVLPSPQRSTSAGTAFMQRVAARRISRPPGTVQSESDAESDLRRSRQHMTEYSAGSTGTPSSLTLQGSPVSTPDTPTRPPRRVQSAHLSSRLPLTEETLAPAARLSLDIVSRVDDLKPEWVVKVVKPKIKISRWKAFTSHFRRSHT
jgi:hypothetical protein